MPMCTPPAICPTTISGFTACAHVVGGDEARHRHLAGLGVHLHLGDLAAVAVADVRLALRRSPGRRRWWRGCSRPW